MEDSSAPTLDPIKQLGKSWGWFFVYGILLAALGLIAMTQPKNTAGAVAVFFAIAIILTGIFDIVGAIASEDEGSRWPGVIGGIVSLIIGTIILRNIHASVAFVGLILGIFWLVRGVLMIVSGLVGRNVPGRGWRVIGGLIFAVLGAYVLGSPTTGPALIMWLLGILFFLAGILEVIVSITMRNAAKTT